MHVHAMERTGEELKLDWNLWEVMFFLNHRGEGLTVSVVHPHGTGCLGIQSGPLNQME